MGKCIIGIEYPCDECSLCDSSKKINKPTNADRIRGMSNEELTKFIESVRCSSLFFNEESGLFICKSMDGNYCHVIKDKEPSKDILEWLQQPEK